MTSTETVLLVLVALIMLVVLNDKARTVIMNRYVGSGRTIWAWTESRERSLSQIPLVAFAMWLYYHPDKLD